ncbi:thioredoxin family protein [Lactiplantibacillus sp. WILCCON 0030]|uniref:Thioredoxin family protein n=1 Tax=Lactiplantibacillus brownii TaxID=3069269 RepID=A0ABU1ABT3_9LACO|nr:thioredoxin family protein [Lactiplantibacillus brownii]MDQ7938380.1 thioredoxin family protein [Lactiplantibacillus brownii]
MVKSPKLQLLYFKAKWCAQCYTEQPIIEQLTAKFQSQLQLRQFDRDEVPELVTKYQLMTVPSFVIKRDQKVLYTATGYMTNEQLKTLISYYL